MQNESDIEIPTYSIVNKYVKEFSNGYYGKVDKVLDCIFRAYANVDTKDEANLIDCIHIKVSALNSFYSTQIKYIEIEDVINHIVGLYKNQDFEQKIIQGLPEAVQLLRTVNVKSRKDGKQEKERDFYSFATKYCSFECRANGNDCFPMFDSYVAGVLIAFRDYFKKNNGKKPEFNDFKNYELRNEYKRFKDIIDEFRNAFRLDRYSYKQLDQYLWSYGKVNKLSKYISRK